VAEHWVTPLAHQGSPETPKKPSSPMKKGIFPYETPAFSSSIRTASEEAVFFW
jgi:hypothetical protein